MCSYIIIVLFIIFLKTKNHLTTQKEIGLKDFINEMMCNICLCPEAFKAMGKCLPLIVEYKKASYDMISVVLKMCV